MYQTKSKFRFHTGSIKSYAPISTGQLLALCFDSILVRLKAGLVASRVRVALRFDSILVRLKEIFSGRTHPSMQTFRFHTGSIKRCCRFKERELGPRVSIPYWFD